jgi:hypothetical protein
MKIVKSSKDITTLEVGDVVMFGNLKYVVTQHSCYKMYYLLARANYNDKIFRVLNINKRDFIEKLGIDANCNGDFPETKSLEALTAIVSALLKEYEKQNELPKTWEEFCKRNPVTPDEYWIETVESRYCNNSFERERDIDMDKNVCVSLQEAQAFTALMQLRQLHKAYVKDWEPDWNNTKQYKANIMHSGTDFIIAYFNDLCSRPLSFPTYELAEQFLNNFKDLLEIAKPLL